MARRHRSNAKTLVGTILVVWCRAKFPALPRPALPYSKAIARSAGVTAFVETLLTLEFLDATYWLSFVYAAVTDEDCRKKQAMFFTPPSLTKGLLDDLSDQEVDFTSQRFLDPACGGAAFLAPIALRMRDALARRGVSPRQLLRHVERHLYGMDIDAGLCELSKQFLRMALYEEIQKSGYVPNFQVHQANSLTALGAKHGKMDVVVCNPHASSVCADMAGCLRLNRIQVAANRILADVKSRPPTNRFQNRPRQKLVASDTRCLRHHHAVGARTPPMRAKRSSAALCRLWSEHRCEHRRSSVAPHGKVILCDRNVAYVGSSNMTGASLEHSMEMGVALQGRAVADAAVVLDAVVSAAGQWT